ncbi:MAG TPA: PaaI family thioesterase [Desulfobacteraceae bacterium]|jgi:acyl-CoA thioesterase|nr:PaaI family thioesterase [Desulfobacteraceae bacterium]
MDSVVKGRLIAKAAAEGYVGKLGLEVVDVSEGHAVVEMLPGVEDENLFGYVHGGVICGLMDEAFQLACNSHGTIAVALNISVVFHSPAFKGSRLRAEANEVHLGRRTGTYTIRVVDTKREKLIASCQATAYRKNVPLPFLDPPKENSEAGKMDSHC